MLEFLSYEHAHLLQLGSSILFLLCTEIQFMRPKLLQVHHLKGHTIPYGVTPATCGARKEQHAMQLAFGDWRHILTKLLMP